MLPSPQNNAEQEKVSGTVSPCSVPCQEPPQPARRPRIRRCTREMAREDPELAARLVLMTLPAAAARIPGTLSYDLEVGELGTYRVQVNGGSATVTPVAGLPPRVG